jgi:23S rRNA (uracil1939-C5)-methyltransferase
MPGNNLTITITGLSHEGRGIAQINGKTVFVDNALPGETLEIEITKKHGRYNEGRMTTIIEASPARIIPRCIHFEICGGCHLQHINAEDQISLKQHTLLEQLKHTGHTAPEKILPPLQSPPWGYRYKGRLSVKYLGKKQKLLIGFHEKNGRFVADLTRCEVLKPTIGLSFELLRQLILSLSVFQHLPQIEIACDDKNCALIFRCLQVLSEDDKKLLCQFGETHHFLIYIHPNKPEKLFKLWPDNGNDSLSYSLSSSLETAPPIEIFFHPANFTQINPAINQQMVMLAIELLDLDKNDTALDLFCGLGNFTLPLAQHCHQVTGIEGDAQLILRARENALHNRLSNTEFYTANLFEPDKSFPWIQKKYDKLLLDPPRTGAIEILPYVAQWKPQRIVYVSCNPATLARDAGELVHKYGYRLLQAGVMDMFPHTRHVESIALFTR